MNKNYKLVWSEEFAYEGELDSSKWMFEIGTGYHGWGNNQAQYYTDRTDNAVVRDGKLIISALKEDYEGKHYTSARIKTYNQASWQYGRIEVKAKLPKGNGTWPAIWMMPDSFETGTRWPSCGEIDIMEHLGRKQDQIHFSLHTGKYNHNQQTQLSEYIDISNVSDEFNVYRIDWTEDSIEFFVNDVSYTKFVKDSDDFESWPFDQPFYLIINLAIGGYWAKDIDDDIFPQTLEVDYIRVYSEE